MVSLNKSINFYPFSFDNLNYGAVIQIIYIAMDSKLIYRLWIIP